jgi:hypothetical protein
MKTSVMRFQVFTAVSMIFTVFYDVAIALMMEAVTTSETPIIY